MLCATPAERKTDPAQLRLTNQDEGEEGLGKEIKVLYVEKIRSDNERDYEGKALYTVCVVWGRRDQSWNRPAAATAEISLFQLVHLIKNRNLNK